MARLVPQKSPVPKKSLYHPGPTNRHQAGVRGTRILGNRSIDRNGPTIEPVLRSAIRIGRRRRLRLLIVNNPLLEILVAPRRLDTIAAQEIEDGYRGDSF